MGKATLAGEVVEIAMPGHIHVARSLCDRVDQLLADGAIVRTWPMRGTLHFVAAEDLGWLVGLLGPRVLSASPARRRQLGITPRG